MKNQKLLSLLIEAGSIVLSAYGFASSLYWYWVFTQSAPLPVSSFNNSIVLQGIPLSHIMQSLVTIALGGFAHTMNKFWPEILDLLKYTEQSVEGEVVDLKIIEELRARVSDLEKIVQRGG